MKILTFVVAVLAQFGTIVLVGLATGMIEMEIVARFVP